jgi:hypothetical protein
MTAAKDALPPVEAPKIAPELGAESKAAPDAPTAEIESLAPEKASRWQLPSYAPLAAGIAFAVLLGALAGSATTIGLLHDPSPPALDATKALQESVSQLGNELASLKAGINASQRTASTQFGKLAERLDRTEKAASEPTAKLAKLQDSIDKLDLRQQQAAVTAASSDITGSVAAKQEAKVPEGWRLRDFYAGRAVVESKNGTLFEVGPGSNVPGLGKVETIKRDNGRVVVVTSGGTITAALEPRRPSYGLPYRY